MPLRLGDDGFIATADGSGARERPVGAVIGDRHHLVKFEGSISSTRQGVPQLFIRNRSRHWLARGAAELRLLRRLSRIFGHLAYHRRSPRLKNPKQNKSPADQLGRQVSNHKADVPQWFAAFYVA